MDTSKCPMHAGNSRGWGQAPDLAEAGRLLASQRDDLIAQGVNPADLAVPICSTTSEIVTTPAQVTDSG